MELRRTNLACNCVLLCGITLCLFFGTNLTAAIELYAPAEVLVENGTTGILKCSFKSREVISSAATVTWSFRPTGSDPGSAVSIFYYTSGKHYPGSVAQFKDRVKWAGDLNKKDASVHLIEAQFNDNGTYSCAVINPPDISVTPVQTQLKVVIKESLPQNSTAVIVSAVCGAVIGLILIAVVTCLIIKRHQTSHEYEGCTSVASVSSHATRPGGKKHESSSEGSRCSSPSAPVQGPVIYAQLDHSGTKNPNSFHKMEPVVYADIRKN
ncbi:myelin protein zero-like protein 1 isoform X2 [Salmo salar]|uniref:Myelin protein zero-like protein 1 isoform X2 n=1 Tax=Salmo salar TaxID=8030 RepID=A0A1S3RM32_SALSA|nr:myelin protein zero-like protein 1 isoform X2 [Salmo salar]XP_029555769.1 myelin protein zero-like protein 1 isoform X2 [Salmo trutta]|eukprot:XP_014053323.1 PREDICTED: myelin protein zero-like protein 1 isoform X2 [Salmo salar]